LLRKEVASEIIKYQIEAKGDGFAQARESFKGTSSDSSLRELASSLAKVDYSNDDLLTFVWLMALVDTNAKKLLLDSSQPFDLESLAGDLEGLELNHEKFLADAKRRLLEDVDIDEILQNVADLDRRSEL
jgi:hypothetical protein